MKVGIKAVLGLSLVASIMLSAPASALISTTGHVWLSGLPGHKVEYTSLERLAYNVVDAESDALAFPYTGAAQTAYSVWGIHTNPGPVGHWANSPSTGPQTTWMIAGFSQIGDLFVQWFDSSYDLAFVTWGLSSF